MSPLVKLALELGPLVAFFASFQYFRAAPLEIGGVAYQPAVAATAVFIPAILLSLALSWRLSRTLPRMAVVTAIVVVVFGGLTLWLNDDAFIKMKPTIVNALFALALGVGLLQGRSYLKYLMEDALPLTDAGWTIFTRRWMLFFVFLAALNEVVWRTQSTEFWVGFKTFANIPITLAFMASQAPMLKRHWVEAPRG